MKLTGDSDWSAENLNRLAKKMESYDVPGADPEVHGKDGWLHIKKSDDLLDYHQLLYDAAAVAADVPRVEDPYADPNSLEGVYRADLQMHNDGTRSYVATDLIKPTQKRCKQRGSNNFEVHTNQLVTRVVFEGKRAVGVEVIDAPRAYQVDAAHKKSSRDGPRKIYRANKEVILCGGAINTPQLLMLSGIRPADHLKDVGITPLHDLPGVGAHVQDHMECTVNFEIKNIPGKIFPFQALFAGKFNPYWRRLIKKSTWSSLGAFGIIDWHSGLGERNPLDPDIHLHMFNFPFRDFNFNPKKYKDKDRLKGADLRALLQFANPFFPKTFQSFLVEILKVDADTGTVRLRNADPTAPPIIDERLSDADGDVERLAAGLELGRKIMADPSLAPFEPKEVLPGPAFPDFEATKDYVRRYSSYGHHISGTTKMGPDGDPMAVVDNNLKVHGIDGLRVCDTSIFPTIPGYNTSRPTYMIGEALAEKMKRGL